MSKTTNNYFSEVRERAVRMVLNSESQHESRWSSILSVSSKIGCAAQKLKTLERENRELRQANEILRKASA